VRGRQRGPGWFARRRCRFDHQLKLGLQLRLGELWLGKFWLGKFWLGLGELRFRF
jgi:hypothetical protein